MYDIIVSAYLALMILATKSWYHTWCHGFFYDIIYDITKTWFFSPFLRYSGMISTMLSYTYSHILAMISTTYDIGYDLATDIIPFNINNFLYLWYQNFHVIVADIMVPARLDGAACGRHAPAAPPPPASHRMQSADAQKPLELPVWTRSSSWSGITVMARPYMASQRSRPVGRGPGKCSSCYYVLGIG